MAQEPTPQVVTGDYGIMTKMVRQAKVTNTTPITATKNTGLWVERAGQIPTGSAMGAGTKTGDLFYTYPGDTFTPIAGDSYYPYKEYWVGFGLSWTIAITPTIINTTPYGSPFPRSREGRQTVDANMNCQLEEGPQISFADSDVEELPTVDMMEIKRRYMEFTRMKRNETAKKTNPVLEAVGDTNYGAFGISKRTFSLMFYSIRAEADLGVVSAYFAPTTSWAGANFGSGDIGARSEFSMPITFQQDRLNRNLKAYEFTYVLPDEGA